MTDPQLFELPGSATAAAEPSRDARLTQRNRASIANGRHPATGHRLLDAGWGFRCGDCAHAVATGRGNRAFWKCQLHRLGMSHSASSDIRVSWPACDLLRIDPEEPA